jgi:hypothetical protein
MRRLMTFLCHDRSNQEVSLKKFSLKPVTSLLTVAAVLTLSPAFGDDPDTPAKPSGKAAASRLKGASANEGMPACLDKLTLSSKQQDQIKTIVRDYDGDLAMVWKQFGDRYLETIRTEASLLAAIEDNLTEPQRKQVRDQRRKTAQRQKTLAGTDVKPNESIVKPASAVEEEIAIVGVSLTAEQETAADKLQEKYLSHLRSLNRDIQGLHTRLVSLEADKLVEIENVLTKEQLMQLREIRQSAPVAPKVAAGRPGAAETE